MLLLWLQLFWAAGEDPDDCWHLHFWLRSDRMLSRWSRKSFLSRRLVSIFEVVEVTKLLDFDVSSIFHTTPS